MHQRESMPECFEGLPLRKAQRNKCSSAVGMSKAYEDSRSILESRLPFGNCAVLLLPFACHVSAGNRYDAASAEIH